MNKHLRAFSNGWLMHIQSMESYAFILKEPIDTGKMVKEG